MARINTENDSLFTPEPARDVYIPLKIAEIFDEILCEAIKASRRRTDALLKQPQIRAFLSKREAYGTVPEGIAGPSPILFISGPAGVGKTTLIYHALNRFLELEVITKSVVFTTMRLNYVRVEFPFNCQVRMFALSVLSGIYEATSNFSATLPLVSCKRLSTERLCEIVLWECLRLQVEVIVVDGYNCEYLRRSGREVMRFIERITICTGTQVIIAGTAPPVVQEFSETPRQIVLSPFEKGTESKRFVQQFWARIGGAGGLSSQTINLVIKLTYGLPKGICFLFGEAQRTGTLLPSSFRRLVLSQLEGDNENLFL